MQNADWNCGSSCTGLTWLRTDRSSHGGNGDGTVDRKSDLKGNRCQFLRLMIPDSRSYRSSLPEFRQTPVSISTLIGRQPVMTISQ